MEDVSDKDIIDSYGRVVDLYDGLTPEECVNVLISFYNTTFNVISDASVKRIKSLIHDSINNDPIAAYERAMKIIT